MSEIARLSISGIRNILDLTVELSPTINLFFGENGSGKTSILEAIHILAAGRSFRNSKLDPLINHESDEAVIYVELIGGVQIGLSKSRRQNHQLKLQSEKQRNWDSVAKLLPVQILDSTSFLLLEGGPRARRRFLDWGVFHVEPNFLSSWRKASKCIANRNLLLKRKQVDWDQLQAWDAELVLAASTVDSARKAYFKQLLPCFEQMYKALGGSYAGELIIEYNRGWDDEFGLDEVLASNKGVDSKYGATQNGPHRADLQIKVDGGKAVDILSRGQQKVLVSALKIAEGTLLSDSKSQKCIFLVDDLPAELDSENRSAVLEQLLLLGGQTFLTCVDLTAIEECLIGVAGVATFHVERGTITT